MKRHITIGLYILILIIASGCSNNDVDSLNKEIERLTKEVQLLKRQNVEKDDRINSLFTETKELKESIEMVRWSSYARQTDYSHSFFDLEKIYKINTPFEIKDDWYVIHDDYFQIQLLDYDNAKQVDFNIIRLESDDGIARLFSDTDASDGWTYTNDTISKIINKHSETFAPYFVLFAEVTLVDGSVIQTPKLPIYYK